MDVAKQVEEAVVRALAEQQKKHQAETKEAIEKALKEQEVRNKKSAALEGARKAKAKKEEEALRKGVYVVYGGTYYHKKNTITTAEDYEVEIQIIDDPYYKLPAEGLLIKLGRDKLLPYYFMKEAREEYPYFKKIREVSILDIKIYGADNKEVGTTSEDKPISKMTLKELLTFTTQKDLETNPNKFNSILAARQAVEDEWENRKIVERDTYGIEEKNNIKKQEEFAELKELLDFKNID